MLEQWKQSINFSHFKILVTFERGDYEYEYVSLLCEAELRAHVNDVEASLEN